MNAVQPDPSATAVALVATARRLFSERGYAAVGTDEIVAQAAVPRSALRRSFGDGKEELFRAVLVQVSAETMRRIRDAALARDDPWDSLVAGIDELLDACATPEVRQVLLTDAPAVLGWDVWQAFDAGRGLAMIERALSRAIDAGRIQAHPPDALAKVLLGALQEAAATIAGATDPATARIEMGTMVSHLLAGIRAQSQ